jgi:succinate dehydrogenase/fumarate reductase cytochrome b subunit
MNGQEIFIGIFTVIALISTVLHFLAGILLCSSDFGKIQKENFVPPALLLSGMISVIIFLVGLSLITGIKHC